MKLKLLTLGLLAALVSCGESTSTEDTNTENKEQAEENVDAAGTAIVDDALSVDLVKSIVQKGGAKSADQETIESMMTSLEEEKAVDGWESKAVGHWVGKFGKNKINISITKIDGGSAEGFSVCAGNFRKIEGTVHAEGIGYRFVMDEPGSDAYDGTFDFTIDKDFKGLSGVWIPFKKEGNTEKKYNLTQQEFEYNTSIGDYPQTSTRLLAVEEIDNLDINELGHMRNEIYARHGYSFKNKEWRYTFEQEDWYMPMGVDIRHLLTDVEIENIGLIYEYELYFDEYYDNYGR